MPTLAPFVMKLSFYVPSKDNSEKNVAHISYITRPGAVDYGDIEPEINYKRFDADPDQVIHARYMGERPGSLGLFGPDGPEESKAVQETLRNHEGLVWRVVVSLREDEAIRIDHTDRSKWEESLRKSFLEIGEKMGIPESNFRWVAAYHPESGHPHCHCLFWEANPARIRGQLSRGEYYDTKKALVKQIYSQQRERLLAEKTYIRDNLRQATKEEIQGIRQDMDSHVHAVRAEIGTAQRLPPRLDSINQHELLQKLQHLGGQMPGHGRIALGYMPEEIKAEARDIASWILSQPGFAQDMESYLDNHKEITEMYTHKNDQVEKAVNKAYLDLRDRLAQEVLRGAVNCNQFSMDRSNNQSHKLVLNVWKGAWQSLQREKSKTEYQARMLKAQREYEEKEQKRREARDR